MRREKCSRPRRGRGNNVESGGSEEKSYGRAMEGKSGREEKGGRAGGREWSERNSGAATRKREGTEKLTL